MTKPPFVLATAEEIRAITARAVEDIDALFGGDEDDDAPDDDNEHDFDPALQERQHARIRASVEALRFCAVAAGFLGDPSVLDVIVDALDTCSRLDNECEPDSPVVAAGLSWLLRAGAPLGDDVEALARDSDAEVREAIARGLSPDSEAEIALLEHLASDPVAAVRTAAKLSLAPVRDVAWWRGKFSIDPATRVSASEAARMKPQLDLLSAMLDEPAYRANDRAAELVALCSELPDAIAMDLASTRLRASDPHRAVFVPLGTLLLAIDGGPAAFIGLCAAWSKSASSHYLATCATKMVRALPMDTDVRVCKQLLAHVSAVPREQRTEPRGAAAIMATAVAGAWPVGEALTPILDAVLAAPEPGPDPGENDWVVSALLGALRADHADPEPFLTRAIDARLAGYPGAWKGLASAIDGLLDRARPEVIREAAERALGSNDDAVVAWGIEQCLTRAYDPKRDAPPVERARQFLSEARHRAVIEQAGRLHSFAAAIWRAELRSGKLSFAAAARTMETLNGLYGGIAEPAHSETGETAQEVAAELAKEQARYEAFLGPAELRGAPTEAEWAMLRSARDASPPVTADEFVQRLSVLPEGPWAPADRAVLDAALETMSDDPRVSATIVLCLSAKPSLDDLPIFDRMIAARDEQEGWFFRRFRSHTRARLGLPREAAAPPAPAAGKVGWSSEEAS